MNKTLKRDLTASLIATAVVSIPSLTAVMGEKLLINYATGTVTGFEFASVISNQERLLSLLFLIALPILFYFRKGILLLINENNPGYRCGIVLVFLPWLPLLFHNAFFSISAFHGLYVGDFDFTNISSALNRTAHGDGILITPFVSTGNSGSFLGHHFAPSLLLYLPFYIIFHLLNNAGLLPTAVSGHQIYGMLLWSTLTLGVFFWSRLIHYFTKNNFTAILISAALCLAYPVWRLAGSFHFEIMVLPLSALTIHAYLKNEKHYWIYLFLWMGIKEDISVYTAFFGLYIFFNGQYKNGLLTGIFSVLYFLAASGPLHDYFSGSAGTDFYSYFQMIPTENNFKTSFFGLLFTFAFLPVLSFRLFFLVILPIAAVHYNSGHPWHNTFYGHYVYSILPFLMYGFMRSFRNISGWNGLDFYKFKFYSIAAVFCLILYADSAEKENPPLLFAEDARYADLNRIIPLIEKNSCVKTLIPFTAHIPLNSRVFPVAAPKNNPVNTDFSSCRKVYLLIDKSDARIPYYTYEKLSELESEADSNMKLIKTSGKLKLYANF